MSRGLNSVKKLNVVTEVLPDFLQTFHLNAGTVLQIRPSSLPAMAFATLYSLIIPSFDTMLSELPATLIKNHT
jgi:hypothetical protein